MANLPKEPSSEEWQAEAQAVVKDIRKHVLEAFVSEKLVSSRQTIFINIETLEGNHYCIRLTGKGFEIVGKYYDCNELTEEKLFETPYSLLQSISPGYVTSFGEALIDKLKSLESIGPSEN